MKRKNNKNRSLKKPLVYLFSLTFLGLGIGFFWISTFKMPDLQSFEERSVSQGTKIYDRTGEIILFDLNQNIKREEVSFENISKYIKTATVAIEDSNFYNHGGIQIKAILRAVLANLTGGEFNQGGSTITQQVIKNSLLTTEKLISRKLKEWVLAIKLEKIISKDDILTIYLNESPYGGSIYGIEEATKTFFHKKSSEVTLAEAAYLAAIPNAPTYYSPYGNNRDKLENRKNLVLKKMLDNKFINQTEYSQALKEIVVFQPRTANSIKAPHFVEYVRQYLEKKYGEKMIRENGLKVITTINYDLQQKAEAVIKKYALENKIKFNAENAALVGIDPKTGEILTMVGSRDYFDKDIDGNFNVALAQRQPGSTFKPFVYATAFEKGYTPETVVFDLPTEFQTTCTPQGRPIGNTSPDDCYMPENYDGKYVGPITLREALAQSRNVPAIKTLYLAGISASIETAKKMGITSLGDKNQYGLTLVLGGGEVSPLELTSAYGVFANEGIKNSHISILKVTKANGETLEEVTYKPEQVIDKEISNKISDILSDNIARIPAFGDNSPLHFKDRQVAVKTGTTNDYRDVWIVGYTPNFVVGAWAGNNNNTSIDKKVAGMVIAPMWRAFMDEALPTFNKEYFSKPEQTSTEIKPVFRGIWQGYDFFTIDTISGKMATNLTPTETRKDVFIPDVHNILHWVDKNDPWGAVPKNPERDPQYKYWEYPVQLWLRTNNLIYPTQPKDWDDVHTKEKSPKISIINPNTNNTYLQGQKIVVQAQNNSYYPIAKLDFYINNVYVGTNNISPFLFSFIPENINSINNFKNTLKIIATDSVFNKTETEVDFFVSEE